MAMRIKTCGITNVEDAFKAVKCGAWALGFVFYQKSPRYISPSRVRKIVEVLPPLVTPVGVFVNHNERAVRDICQFTRIHTVQFHGDEDPRYCTRFKDFKIIKAFRVKEDFDFEQLTPYKVDVYLFDAFDEKIYGGSGRTFNWNILKERKFARPVILSGGLNPDNVGQALETFEPYAVDVSSGVEKSPGVKDHGLMGQFLKKVT